ncbi:MAG: hypothetical protein D6834_03005, partial [Aquificota bacterium]
MGVKYSVLNIESMIYVSVIGKSGFFAEKTKLKNKLLNIQVGKAQMICIMNNVFEFMGRDSSVDGRKFMSPVAGMVLRHEIDVCIEWQV